jgi:HSP20 family protein
MADIAKQEEKVRTFTPYLDIISKKDDFVVMADVPGALKDGVDISLEKGVLSVKAKVGTPEVGDLPMIHREYMTGDYEFSLRISEGVNTEKIEAELKNGVLILTLPRAEEVKPKQIKVSAA